ncbi:hypothetical protein ACX1C1_04895 [Paenibacillus sp. strain BS8-2]
MNMDNMTNISTSQFTFAKREGQLELAIHLNNVGTEPRSLRLSIKDAESGTVLPASVDGSIIEDVVTVPGGTVQQMIINTADAAKQVAIEVIKEAGQGGVSLRQRSSSSNGVPNNLIEMLLK